MKIISILALVNRIYRLSAKKVPAQMHLASQVELFAHPSDAHQIELNVSSPLTETSDIQIRLPRTDLPKFNGLYES